MPFCEVGRLRSPYITVKIRYTKVTREMFGAFNHFPTDKEQRIDIRTNSTEPTIITETEKTLTDIKSSNIVGPSIPNTRAICIPKTITAA